MLRLEQNIGNGKGDPLELILKATVGQWKGASRERPDK